MRHWIVLGNTVHPHMRGEDPPRPRSALLPHGSPPHAWGRLFSCPPDWGTSPVHPHMRGEDARQDHLIRPCLGSPPHAWGRLPNSLTGYSQPRFTPTCVGKTLAAFHFSIVPPVHPHMRGEDGGFELTKLAVNGSPPHAWGRRTLPNWASRYSRFTPTCVGKTEAQTHTVPARSVHPHMRGEDPKPTNDKVQRLGSPPHAWGRLPIKKFCHFTFRFTPTCVGKTIIGPA